MRDRLTCPFDAPEDTKERPLGDLELHMAMKQDDLHQSWRNKHKIPAGIEVYDLKRWRQRIRIAILQDLEIFNQTKRLK